VSDLLTVVPQFPQPEATTATTTTAGKDGDDSDDGRMETKQSQYIEPLFSVEFNSALLVLLSDGSFVARASYNVNRWSIASNPINKTLQLIGTYTGHNTYVSCAIEKDSKSLITGSYDRTI